MVKICTIIVILECDIEYISPSECLQIAPWTNGEVNGRHPEAQMDPYEDVVKAHLEKLEKAKRLNVVSVCSEHKLVRNPSDTERINS